MRAFLWTPEELVRLDLEPRLQTAERQLAFLDRRLIQSSAPLGNRTRRAAALVTVLRFLIAQARQLPAHDARAAKGWIAQLEQRAARLRGRWPAWLYARVAEYAAWRLLPHTVVPSPGARLPSAVRARVAQLRARGALVVVPPSTGMAGIARRPPTPRRARVEPGGAQ